MKTLPTFLSFLLLGCTAFGQGPGAPPHVLALPGGCVVGDVVSLTITDTLGNPAGVYRASAAGPPCVWVSASTIPGITGGNPVQVTNPIVFTAGTLAYYVSNTGSDSNTGLSPLQAWQTIAKVNAQLCTTFVPGTQILFQAGGVWREQLTIPCSGNATAPIVFGSYGSGVMPEITAANVVSSWTQEGSLYYASGLLTDPGTVSRNDLLLIKVAAKGSVVNSTQWWYDSVNFRAYTFGNPAGQTMEIGTRVQAINLNGKNFVTITGLWIESGTTMAVDFTAPGSHGIVVGNLIKNIVFGIETANLVGDSGSILNNTITNCYAHCIVLGNGNISGWLISGNSVSYGGYADPTGSTNCSGIYLSIGTGTGNFVQNNDVHHNGLGVGAPTAVACHGIYNDNAPGSGQVTIRYNRSHDNFGSGIQNHGLAVLDHNVIYGNAIGILFEQGGTGSLLNNTVVNNVPSATATGAAAGVFAQSASTVIATMSDNIIAGNNYKNGANQSYNQQVYVISPAAITAGNGNDIWGWQPLSQAENLVSYQGAAKTFVQWQALGYDAAGISASPLFNSMGSHDFRLTPSSPAINTGLNLGTTYQYGLSSQGGITWPPALADENSFGTGWEIGAYVYDAGVSVAQHAYGDLPIAGRIAPVIANYSVLPSDSGTTFVNSSAPGEVDFTLPICTAGLNYSFLVDTPQLLKVIAQQNAKIRNNTAAGALNGNISATINGNYVSLTCQGYNNSDGVSEWVIRNMIGPWFGNVAISSGFGTSPSISTSFSMPSAFRVNVGTGGAASSGVITMPTAAAGWNCDVGNITAHAAHRADDTVENSSTTTTVTVENQTKSTGAAVAWTASDILQLECFPF